MDEELYSVAIHEAGHVVMANTFRYVTDSIELFRNAQNQWSGRSHIRFQQNIFTQMSAPERKAKIAISGILAQAKQKAEEVSGSVCAFDLSDGIAELADFLSEPIRTSDDQRTFGFRFCFDNSSFVQPMAGVHYSDSDKGDFLMWRRSVQDTEAVQKLIRHTMGAVGAPENWFKVEELAQELVTQTPDGPNQRRTLDADRINQLLPLPSPWESNEYRQ